MPKQTPVQRSDPTDTFTLEKELQAPSLCRSVSESAALGPAPRQEGDRGWDWLDLCHTSVRNSNLGSTQESSEGQSESGQTRSYFNTSHQHITGEPVFVEESPASSTWPSNYADFSAQRSRSDSPKRQLALVPFKHPGAHGLHRGTREIAGRTMSSRRMLKSANAYVRPLPSTFEDRDLYRLCMSLGDDDRFQVVSVKVIVEDEDERTNSGSHTGYGFCLWNSVEACSMAIERLKAQGYQASFARETSKGILSSLADRNSANLYLSNIPHYWNEEDLKKLFGDTHIASARLLREGDDDVVGTGPSRGVGFVRLNKRSDALRFVDLLQGMTLEETGGQLQCRMADSPAQKEWKQKVRMRYDERCAIDPIPPTSLRRSSRLQSMSREIRRPHLLDDYDRERPAFKGSVYHHPSPCPAGESHSSGFRSIQLTPTAPPFVMPSSYTTSSTRAIRGAGPLVMNNVGAEAASLRPAERRSEIPRMITTGPWIPFFEPRWYTQSQDFHHTTPSGSTGSLSQSASPYGHTHHQAHITNEPLEPDEMESNQISSASSTYPLIGAHGPPNEFVISVAEEHRRVIEVYDQSAGEAGVYLAQLPRWYG